MRIFELFGSIMVDSSKADKSIAKTGKGAEGLSTKMGKGIKTAAKWGLALGTAAIGIAAAGTVMVNKFASVTDELDKTSMKMGISTDALQELRYAMGQVGVNQTTMDKALQRTNQRLGEAAAGNKKYQDALVELGFSIDDVKNGQLDTDAVFMQSIDTLNGMENGQKAAALAAELFGVKTAQELMPAIEAGTLSIEELRAKTHELGGVISEDGIAAGVLWSDTMDTMKTMMGGVFNSLATQLLPTFQIFLEWVMDKMPVIQSVTKTAFDVAGTAITNVSNFVQDNIIPIFKSLFKLIVDNKDKIEVVLSTALNVLTTAFGAVKKAVQFVIDNMNVLLPVIIGITAAVTAQMIINALVTAYKAWQTVTKTQTALQWLLNIALNANPLGLVALAVGVLVAAIYSLYKNFDKVTSAIKTAWEWLTKWNKSETKDKNVNVKTNYSSTGGGMTGGVPRYASGTDFHPGGMAIVGERGAELVNLPRGSSVKTASETKDMLAGKQPIILQTILNGRVIAEEIHNDIGQLMGGRTNLNYAMKGV